MLHTIASRPSIRRAGSSSTGRSPCSSLSGRADVRCYLDIDRAARRLAGAPAGRFPGLRDPASAILKRGSSPAHETAIPRSCSWGSRGESHRVDSVELPGRRLRVEVVVARRRRSEPEPSRLRRRSPRVPPAAAGGEDFCAEGEARRARRGMGRRGSEMSTPGPQRIGRAPVAPRGSPKGNGASARAVRRGRRADGSGGEARQLYLRTTPITTPLNWSWAASPVESRIGSIVSFAGCNRTPSASR